MRTFLVSVFFLASFFCEAQIGDRTIVSGSISVPSGEDPEGISIFNSTSNQATVSTEDGDFVMAVAVGDELIFTALQFQEFRVVIDQNVVDAKEINVYIRESTTELPEVVVRPFDLSGTVEVDVQRIPVVEANFPGTEHFNEAEWDFRPDSLTSPENAAMRTSMMREGLNFANIFRRVLVSRASQTADFRSLEEEVRQLYDDKFFTENFSVSQEEIYHFILYAEENGLSKEMLEEGNELELIAFLMQQSEEYKRNN